MRFATFVCTTLFSLAHSALAFSKFNVETMRRAVDNAKRDTCNDGNQTPRLFVLPTPPTNLGLKLVPDPAHPFIAPGPNDMRGPCPALNTMANHNFINHTGIVTSEEVLLGAVEAFNMGFDFAGFLVALASLTRGNANIAMFSIGGPSDLVPPLPGCIDGPVAAGLRQHGRFEGDISLTREDNHVGDSVNFQENLFDELLEFIGEFGDSGPEGDFTIANLNTMAQFKFQRINEEQAKDNEMQFHINRQLTSYAEVAFVLDLFANGTTNTASILGLSSIFRNQTFAPNWFRRSSPAELPELAVTLTQVLEAHPFPPGANDAQGNYIVDTPPSTNFACDGYASILENSVPAVLLNTTGILNQNVNTFLDMLFTPFAKAAGCTVQVPPGGPSGT